VRRDTLLHKHYNQIAVCCEGGIFLAVGRHQHRTHFIASVLHFASLEKVYLLQYSTRLTLLFECEEPKVLTF